MAGPLRGEGGPGPAIKEKRNFFKTFFLKLCCHLKLKSYFTLDKLSKYGHITLKFVGRYFYRVFTRELISDRSIVFTIFVKNRAILVQIFGEEKRIVKIRFLLF